MGTRSPASREKEGVEPFIHTLSIAQCLWAALKDEVEGKLSQLTKDFLPGPAKVNLRVARHRAAAVNPAPVTVVS